MKVRAPEPEGFSEFWALWLPVCRESDGKPKAREAYRKHLLMGANPEDIVLAARWHIRQREANKTLPYIQLASSWLNAERYEFEAQKERDYQQRSQERPQNVVPIKAKLPDNHFSKIWPQMKA